jgi:RND superfamily putative drug exporter
MLRLDALIRRRRAIVLALWGVVLLIALPLARHQSDHLSGGGFDVPGTQSAAVQRAIAHDFERGQATMLAAVLVPQRGATLAAMRAAVDHVGRAAAAVPDASLPPASRAQARARLAHDGVRPIIVPLGTTVSDQQAIDVAGDLRDRLGLSAGGAARGGVATHLVGQAALWAGMQDLSKEDLLAAESIGFPIVLLILLAVFGSLVAAILPVALGIVAVTVTGALIYAASLVTGMSVYVTNMASMIGIGVAVDYSLFVLARYRQEIAAGRAPEEARGIALATSGVAVTFSGAAVVVSLAGLFVVDTMSLRTMALGAILVVAVAVMAAATLLPALISLVGPRAYTAGRVARLTGAIARSWAGRRAPRGPFWQRWTAAVMRRPVAMVLTAAAVLLALAIPTLSLRMGNGALYQVPKGQETRVGVEAAARIAGPGAATPIEVVAPSAQAPRVVATLRGDREVARVAAPVRSRDGATVRVAAIARHPGETPQVEALVGRLRATLPNGALVGGSPADNKDFLHEVSSSMGLIVLFVLGLSYLVLLLLLRSVILPLKAVLMNLLSVGASYGVLVAVFQWGWVDGFLGFQSPGYIDALTPPLVLAVVFGLSMDYEVFLLTRIRERWAETGDARGAVADGLQASARTITSAALIMAAVFAVFVGTGMPSIKELGLGCSVAIVLDATLVRLVLVPAAMELLGSWNWWLPRPLARLLPRLVTEEAPVLAPARS